MSQIPPGPEYDAVRELGEQFARAGQELGSKERAQRRRRRVLAPVLGTVLATLVVGGGVGVGLNAFDHDRGPLRGEPKVPAGARRSHGDWRLAQARASDPVERALWGLSLYPSVNGSTCVVAGRILGGRLGRLQNGQFRELPASTQGTCSDLTKQHLLVTFRDYGELTGARTLLFGVGDRTITGLELQKDGHSTLVPIAPDGTFIVALKGAFQLRASRLRIDSVKGTSTHSLGG